MRRCDGSDISTGRSSTRSAQGSIKSGRPPNLIRTLQIWSPCFCRLRGSRPEISILSSARPLLLQVPRMADQDQFGPRLRREREKRRIELEEIAVATNVGIELWEGLERNDFSRWPTGIFARAFVRDYARVVGLDADAIVDEFCRHFSIGDRRASRIVRAHGELIGHNVDWAEGAEPLPAGRERRRRNRDEPPPQRIPSPYRPRVLAATIDVGCVGLMGLTGGLFSASFWAAAGFGGLLYFTAATVLTGSTLGTKLLEVLRHRAPSLFTSRRPVSA
jgi:transcriptional regulator with XRE-family HTH domain